MSHESSFQDHAAAASHVGSLGFAVITLSDTRSDATDMSGKFIKNALTEAGHTIPLYRVLKEDRVKIKTTLQDCLADPQINVVITNGGTGIASRDSTIEVLSSVLEKQLDGFGELFRMLSYQEIGPAAMMSRAIGGIAKNRVLFAIPGSTNAVRLAMEKLILPQAGHIYWELNKHLRVT
jgi:molybdenum cofactor biosynthesis protein B